MVKTTPDGDDTVVETSTDHGLSTGDEVKIRVERKRATLDPSLLVLNGVHAVTRRSARQFTVARKTAKDLGRGDVGVLENWSRNRLETAVFTIPSLEVVLKQRPFVLSDVRQLEIRPRTGFAQHVFLDSIELIRD